jgi:hypothetical protein
MVRQTATTTYIFPLLRMVSAISILSLWAKEESEHTIINNKKQQRAISLFMQQ